MYFRAIDLFNEPGWIFARQSMAANLWLASSLARNPAGFNASRFAVLSGCCLKTEAFKQL
jgi:hypothetical protein